jgi:hypothetical protein
MFLECLDVDLSVGPIRQQSGGDALHFATKLLPLDNSLDGFVR